MYKRQPLDTFQLLFAFFRIDGQAVIEITFLAVLGLTTMLERMENQGLISRVQSETDKRKTLLFLTFHMAMNLVALFSEDAYNMICEFLCFIISALAERLFF